MKITEERFGIGFMIIGLLFMIVVFIISTIMNPNNNFEEKEKICNCRCK